MNDTKKSFYWIMTINMLLILAMSFGVYSCVQDDKRCNQYCYPKRGYNGRGACTCSKTQEYKQINGVEILIQQGE